MIGQSLGHYRIEAKLGEGGMGVVYRAIDTHLDRSVAIKILRQDAASPERKQRFVQEAKAASALNHPNIVHIYEIGSSDGTDYIAMEFVPGKTLDCLMGKTGLPLGDALKYAIQIASALARAHAAGIVHRDLKPANIIISDDGTVKLLDFGLAKLAETTAASGATATMTAHKPQTEEGTILGTVAYMSPEQAEGKPLDARSDIFSFGSVLYEMVTRRRAFEGGSAISTLSAVLHKDPTPLSEISAELPLELEKIVARCLRKDPDRRAQHIADIRLALEDLRDDSISGKLLSASKTGMRPPPARSPRRLALVLSGAAVLLAAAAVGFWWLKRTPAAPARADWVQITSFADSVTQPALSPDGRMLTFLRGPNTFIGPGQVYVKMLPGGDPVQLTRDDSIKMSPIFSPDGSRIAYTHVDGRSWDTWVVPVLGGEPRLWLPNASGLSWMDKSTVLFSEIKGTGMHMALVVAAESRAGARDLYMPPHERGMAHRSYLSPDRKSILLVEMSETGAFVPCRLIPADGTSSGRQVGPPNAACTFAGWSPDGAWMYLTSNAGGAFHIWRQRLNDGSPEQVTSGPTEEEGIALAPDGRSLVTAVGTTQSSVWVHDDTGDRQVSVEGQAANPRFTPDGKKLCFRIRTGAASELWIADLETNQAQPVLPGVPIDEGSDTATQSHPGYDISPDGQRVVFFSRATDGKPGLWIAALDRRSPPRRVLEVHGQTPVFGPSNEIFFRKVEGASAFLYSVKEDGTALRKVATDPIFSIFGPDPSRRWLLLGEAEMGEVLFPIDGGAPIPMGLRPPEWVAWSGDGKNLLVHRGNRAMLTTYVLPLPPGRVLPEGILTPSGILPDSELSKRPGVRLLSVGQIAPGATASVYAYKRDAVQRNLYRIPLP